MNAPQTFPIAEAHAAMGLGKSPVSVESMASPAYFEVEKKAVFAPSWLLVGRESDVPAIGDYFVKRVDPWNTSLIISRAKDKKIYAFHDVCTHRGMRVIGSEQTGNRKAFTCGAHGWVFGLDGKLVDVPDRQSFYDFDETRLGLTPVAVDIWEGFIFVRRDAQAGESLKEFLGEVYSGYEGYFDDSFFHKVDQYVGDIHMNYKFWLDSSVEAYHAGCVHIQNNTGQNAKSGTVLSLAASAVRLYKRHRIVGIPVGIGERDLAPCEALAAKFGGPITPYDPRLQARSIPPALNANSDPNWAFDILELYPNAIMFLSKAMYAVITLWPISVDRCRIAVDIYMTEPENAAERVALEYGLVSLRDVMREDINVAEACTDALTSGAIKEVYFSDQEIAVRHSYAVVDRAVKEYLAKQV